MNGVLVVGDDQIISPEALTKLDQTQIWREKSDEVFDLETFGNFRSTSMTQTIFFNLAIPNG